MIYADMIYDEPNVTDWVNVCYDALADNGSLFIQTDPRSVAEVHWAANLVFTLHGRPGYLNNWIIWPYDWGGRSKRAFGRKHDDILWFVKNSEFKFYPERVSIPKKTTSAGLNPSGRTTKTPTDVWSDIGNFLTVSPERIHGDDGVCIPWQKPERLIDRIVLCSTDRHDLVVDPFLGTGTTAVVCKRRHRKFLGMDCNPEMITIARRRLLAASNE
jgi:DNA modification methylase